MPVGLKGQREYRMRGVWAPTLHCKIWAEKTTFAKHILPLMDKEE